MSLIQPLKFRTIGNGAFQNAPFANIPFANGLFANSDYSCLWASSPEIPDSNYCGAE